MSRKCSTCQHIKRAEIDRRLAGGEPGNQIAQDYGINPSSLHRHRTNCLKLASSNILMKQAAQGTAALNLLPSREKLGNSYAELIERIEQISRQAQAEGSLKIALAGLNSLRQTLDSLCRLVPDDAPDTRAPDRTEADLKRIVERILKAFDQEPAIKQRIATVFLEMADEQSA